MMKIFLRPIKESDGKLIVKWRNAPQVAKHCFSKEKVTEESNRSFFKTYVENGRYLQFIVERIEELSGVASYPIATIYLKDIDRTNHRCELCIFTSDDEEWNTESQLIAVKMMLEKAFCELDMHKVYSYIFTEFDDERKLLESAGLHQESILKNEALNMDGNYCDVFRMVIYSHEFRDRR